jgi:hypothetical protein
MAQEMLLISLDKAFLSRLLFEVAKAYANQSANKKVKLTPESLNFTHKPPD